MMRPLLALLVVLLTAAVRALGADSTGIVMMHGMQGTPGSIVTLRLEKALRSAGYQVETPQMCWSQYRIYDATFIECQRDIDAAIEKLRASGSRRIVVAGMSLGGNAAFGYALTHPDLTGVIALAPAADAAKAPRDPEVQQSVALAAQMVANGHGADKARFSTRNAAVFSVYTTATIYFSFTDPNGPAAFSRRLAELKVPTLWVAGDADGSQATADAVFATLPANRLNRLVHVSSNHLGTPDAAIDSTLTWLSQVVGTTP
jgi:pimeloyl-ACP methyl ester carboxylesterase